VSYQDELSVKLTAKDEMSARLKGVKKELEDTTRAMAKARTEFQDTGSPEALAELKRLEKQHESLAKAYRESSAAARKARDDYKAAADGTAKATTVMGRLGQAVEKHAKRIQQAGIVAAAAMALFARSAIKGYAEAEKSQIMLEQAYSRFPKMADVSITAMRELNTELMNLTGADDDALASAEALLARFDLTGQQIMQLMPLIADYAIATGQELPAATSTIGKAMLGNAKALKSLGINYKATGDRAQDYANIMAILEEKVGGVGKAFGESTAGQLEIANQNFENLKEEVGAGLVPALKLLVDMLRPLVGFLTGLPRPLQQAGFFVAALGIAAMIATPKLIALKAAMNQAGMSGGALARGLSGLGSFLAGPWGIALAVAAAGLLAWMKHMQDAKARVDSLSGSFDTLTGKLTAAGQQQIAETLVGEIDPAHWEFMDTLNIGLDEAMKAIQGTEAEMTSYIDKVNDATKALELEGITAGVVTNNVYDWWKATDGARQAANLLGTALPGVTGDIEDMGDGAEESARQVSALSRAVNRMNRLLNRGLALKDFGKAADAFAKKKSKENARDFISNWNTAYSSFKDGSEAQARFVTRNYGAMKRAIRNSGVKESIRTQMIDELDKARTEAQLVIDKLNQLDGMTLSVTIANKLRTPGMDPARFATGGLVTGPGTGTSDSIPALLSNREYVIRAAAVDRIGVDTLDRLNRADRIPVLPPIVNAPTITLPASQPGRDAPLVGHLEVHASQQVDVDLALLRLHRQQQRDQRTRTAGTR
jgi:hypothetical protein